MAPHHLTLSLMTGRSIPAEVHNVLTDRAQLLALLASCSVCLCPGPVTKFGSLTLEIVSSNEKETHLRLGQLPTNADTEGVVVALSGRGEDGVTRDGVTPKMFYNLLEFVANEVKRIVTNGATGTNAVGKGVNTFVIIRLDNDIETAPGTGQYSREITRKDGFVIPQAEDPPEDV